MNNNAASPATTDFDAVLAAENEVRMMQTIIEFADSHVSTYQRNRQHDTLQAAKARLSALIGSMDMETMAAFGEYRAAQRKTVTDA
jgi:hypothetical protein